MKKRGETLSVIFTVIVVAVSVILVSIFAVKATTAMVKNSERSSLIKVSEEIKAFVDSTAIGQRKTQQFSVHNSLTVCVVDASQPISSIFSANYPIVSSSIQAGTKDNLFFIDKKNQIIMQADLGQIKIDAPSYFCQNSSNRSIILTTEGRGFDVFIIAP